MMMMMMMTDIFVLGAKRPVLGLMLKKGLPGTLTPFLDFSRGPVG